MDIVKNMWDMHLNEDQEFFAAILKEEFGCDTRIEEIKNKAFIKRYSKPLNDFNIYTTAKPTAEGIRSLGRYR